MNWVSRGMARPKFLKESEIFQIKRSEKMVEQIRTLKATKDLTIRQIAERSGLTISTINNLVMAKMIKWQEHHIAAMERAFDVTFNRETLDYE